MVRHTEEQRLKAVAFSLSKALATYKVKLSHQQCLDVLAKLDGHKTYEAMTAGGQGFVAQSGSYEESASRMFDAMRDRVDAWMRARPHKHATPGVLMADAHAVGAALGKMVYAKLERAQEIACSVSLVCEGGSADLFVVHAKGDEAPRLDALNPWKTIEVHQAAHLGASDRGRQGHERLALRLYGKYLEQVELLAKGYATCMEMFLEEVQYLRSDEGGWTVEWRFYEADPSSDDHARKHPMVSCGDHIICATDVTCGLMTRDKRVVDLVVGIWHVPAASMTGTPARRITSTDLDEVFSMGKPHRISVEDAQTEVFSWKYSRRTVGEIESERLKKLLDAVTLATDGAVLIEASGVHGTVNVDGARVVDGKVVLDVRQDYDINDSRVELTQAQTQSALVRIADGAQQGLIKVVGASNGSGGQAEFTPDTAVLDGFAILLMQTER